MCEARDKVSHFKPVKNGRVRIGSLFTAMQDPHFGIVRPFNLLYKLQRLRTCAVVVTHQYPRSSERNTTITTATTTTATNTTTITITTTTATATTTITTNTT